MKLCVFYILVSLANFWVGKFVTKWFPQGFKSEQESQDGADIRTHLSAFQMAICQPISDITDVTLPTILCYKTHNPKIQLLCSRMQHLMPLEQ